MRWYGADIVPATSGAFAGCKWALYDMCFEHFEKREVLYSHERLRNKHPYFEGMTFHLWASLRSHKNAAGYYVKSRSEHFCREHGERFIQNFLWSKYHGKLDIAIAATDSFEQLWAELLDYFEERKARYMAKQKTDIEISKKTGVASAKVPQSHGGVANLLKVLTKTMEKQGADITNIAKMQYTICKQAGIYIPDEFLTDVAVMLDAEVG